jgi:hypothetical protein
MDHTIPAGRPTYGFPLTHGAGGFDRLRCEAATALTVCRAGGDARRRFARLSQLVGAGILAL